MHNLKNSKGGRGISSELLKETVPQKAEHDCQSDLEVGKRDLLFIISSS